MLKKIKTEHPLLCSFHQVHPKYIQLVSRLLAKVIIHIVRVSETNLLGFTISERLRLVDTDPTK
jgi:hypothetical protein